MPLRKEPPTPRSAAVAARFDNTHSAGASSSSSSLGPLIPLRPGQTSLRRQAILTEDEYTSALSSVIKRDFFPDLDRLTAENEYLAAVESDEPRRIRAALDRLLRLDNRRRSTTASPARSKRASDRSAQSAAPRSRGEWDDTPVASASTSRVFDPTLTPAVSTPGVERHQEEEEEAEHAEPGSGLTPDLDLSLADFQARYTSEDNASFGQLLERGNEERKRKHAWLFARERASAEQRSRVMQAEREEADAGRRLAIEANSDHPALIGAANPTLLIEGAGSSKTSEAKTEPMQKGDMDPLDDLVLVSEPRRDERRAPTGLNRWKFTARNALMFGPDADATPLRVSSGAAAPAGEHNDGPRTNFAALRRLDDAEGAEGEDTGAMGSEAGWSPSSSRVDAAIARGRAGSIASSAESAFGVAETPKVNGYGFVTPYATPQHASGPDEDMHLRIYNAIKSRRNTGAEDARASGGQATGGREFELPRLDKREEVAQRLMASASPAAKRAKASPYGTQKYGGLAELRKRAFASPAKQRSSAALSPAARALLDRSTRTLTPGGALSQQGPATPITPIGHRAWTPTPQHPSHRPS